MAKIGLVTVLYKSETVLDGFFESLRKQTFKDFKLYIVNNASPDGSLKKALLEKEKVDYPIEIIDNENNVGVAKGNNQGIERALYEKSEYILLLNNDIEFLENTIEILYSESKKEKIQLMVPKIKYYGTNKIWMAGGRFSKLRGLTIHLGDEENDGKNFNVSKYVDYAPTCFMLINREVFEKIGFMDEKYFVYFDDSDFLYRAKMSKIRLFYNHKTTVEHKVSTSTGGNESLFSIYYGNRNRIYFIRKNYNILSKLSSFSFYFLSRIFKYIRYNEEEKKALLNAIIEGLKMK